MNTDMNNMNAVEIPCCLCGTMIYPNGANQCGSCLAQQVDLRQHLQKGPGGGPLVIHQCRQCRQFQRTESKYQAVDMESPELMSICLKQIPALQPSSNQKQFKLQLMDAVFVWTEPNSMRLRTRLTVRTELHSTKIQQRCLVEFIIKFKQCPDCNREYTNRTWQALVQLRQRRKDGGGETKKGLTVLELALARNEAVRKHVLSMDTVKQGFDFYFLSLPQAQQFAAYLARAAPLKISTTQKLVSTNVKSNTANIKHTVVADMVPLCKDDVVLLESSSSSSNSRQIKGSRFTGGSLALVTKVSSVIHMVDANPKRSSSSSAMVEVMTPESYYKQGGDKTYQVVLSSKRLTKFIVLDVELLDSLDSNNSKNKHENAEHADGAAIEGDHQNNNHNTVADVVVVRESDFGTNDETLTCITVHLGHLLQAGDVVLGYDLATLVGSGWQEGAFSESSARSLPDVILVKKIHVKQQQQEEPPEQQHVKAKSSRSKKRLKRNLQDEKKMRELEEAAARMGFLESNQEEDSEELNCVEQELRAAAEDEEEQ